VQAERELREAKAFMDSAVADERHPATDPRVIFVRKDIPFIDLSSNFEAKNSNPQPCTL
jgi:hypothetical protein